MPNGSTCVRCHGVVEGRQCNGIAIKGRKFCARHGGKALASIDSPSFRHGLQSMERKRFASVGKELLGRIEQFREDPELFSLRDDAAYMTALIDRRAEAAAEGFGVEVFRELQHLYGGAKRAYQSGEDATFKECFNRIGEILTEGGNEAKATDEVVELIGRRVALVEAEQRVAHAKAYTLEVDQAYSLVMQVIGVVKQSVRNADELSAIKAGIGRLLRVYKQNTDEEPIDAEVVDEATPDQ